MSNVPRASLCITLLDDEDYRVLATSPGGLEAFGIFVAMVILGRHRLQQNRAKQVFQTSALKFSESTNHLGALAHVPPTKLRKSLTVFSELAKETGNEPWMYLDGESHLVIRSFFKFNANTGWGGTREGSGRKSRANQDDSENNHLEKSRNPSVTDTVTDTKDPPPPVAFAAPENEEPFVSSSPDPAVEQPPVQNDPAEIARVAAKAERLFPLLDFGLKVRQLAGDFPMTHLDYALEEAHAKGTQGWRYILGVLRRLAVDGLDRQPARASGPSPPTPEYHTAPADSRHRRKPSKD